MGQLTPIYHAASDYLATCVQHELAAHGIGSVVLHNEIPLHTGFTFGARPWAEVLVREEDLAAAGEIVADLEAMLVAEDTCSADPYAPAINIRTATWFSLLCIGMMVFVFLFCTIREHYLFLLDERLLLDGSYAWINPFFLIIAAYAVIGIGFSVLNGQRINHTVQAALLGLLTVPVIIIWLVAHTIITMLRALIGDLISLGRPDSPGSTGAP